MKSGSRQVWIRLDPAIVRLLDKLAKEQGRSRASLMAFAVRQFLKHYDQQQEAK